MPQPTVVILLSDKRSGSTMLQEELCRHAAVQTAPYSPHSLLETHWWLMSAVLLERPEPLFASGKVYDGYGGRKNARAYMVDLLEKCAPGFQPPGDDRTLVFQGWEALCQACAQPVFFEKSPQILAQWAALSLLLEWMEQTTFAVKIIGLVRNPHGVMYSAANLFGTDPGSRQFAWLHGCRNLLAFSGMLPRNTYLFIRYEDIVAEPENGFAEIARFIGIDPDAASGSGSREGSQEKWKRDARYRLTLDPAVEQVARHLGYAAEELENPNAGSAQTGPAMTPPSQVRTARIWLNRRRDRVMQPLLLRIRKALRGRA